MSIPFDIIPINQIFTGIAIPFGIYLFIRSLKTGRSPASRAFSSAILFMTLTVITLSSPLIIKNYGVNQLFLDVSFLLYGITVAFFARTITLLTFPGRNITAVILPALIIITSFVLFYWQNSISSISRPIVAFELWDTYFVSYSYSGSFDLLKVYGAMGVLVMAVGSLLFINQRVLSDNPVIRKRALFLTLAFASGGIASLIQFILAPDYISGPFLSLAGITAAIAALFLFLTTRITMDDDPDNQE